MTKPAQEALTAPLNDETTQDTQEAPEAATGAPVKPEEGVTPTDDHAEDAEGREEGADGHDEDAETFPRAYVERLRRESAGLRERLREAESASERADDLSRRLHAALLAQDGRLVDAEALPYAPEHLESPEALTEAVTALLERKPYLSSQRFASTIPQGATSAPATFSLADALRRGA